MQNNPNAVSDVAGNHGVQQERSAWRDAIAGVAASPWVRAGAGLTLFNFLMCELVRPFTGVQGYRDPIHVGLSAGLLVIVALCYLFGYVVLLALRREEHPTAAVKAQLTPDRVAFLLALAILVNLNLAVLTDVKSQLDQFVPLSADVRVANMDRLIFGTDAWRRFTWLNHPDVDQLYHDLWIWWLASTLIFVGLMRDVRRKNVLLITYFALWTVGPVIHLMMPTAGPLFYADLGHGDRFAALPVTHHTQFLHDYLWEGYVTRTINFAGGISAMPSLHVATVAWAAVAFYRTRMFIPAVLFAFYIFGVSVLTGWHYATDGIVGVAMTLAVYAACNFWQSRRSAAAVVEQQTVALDGTAA